MDDDRREDPARTVEVGPDSYIGIELALPKGGEGEMLRVRVTKWMKDGDGLPVGTAADNPLLDSRLYEVKFVDGNVVEWNAGQ